MNILRLNSTGSFTNIDGDYFSYNTRLSFSYQGEYFVNKTYYSNTTSHHQSHLPYTDFNHKLYYQTYGDMDAKKCLQYEVYGLQQELKYRQGKRKTKNNLNEIERIKNKIDFLSNLINEGN